MKKWLIKTTDDEIVRQLAAGTGWNPFICRILAGRGVLDTTDANAFFNNEQLSDPFLLTDMEKAVETINSFVESGEKITVYGDYDCDGITSTFMLFDYLQALGAEVDWYIPSREEGYGLNTASIDLLHKRGTKLIITVDNGISAVDEAKHIAELGMTLVITDHHQVPDVMPEAAAIVDPHRKDDMSLFRNIAGCGVALKLICAMEGDCETILDEYAPYAAIGTVGDIMPLIDENRLIVRRGIELMEHVDNEGMRALLKKSGFSDDKKITSGGLAFQVCPRINAAGRCEHPKIVMEMLMAESTAVAESKAEQLCRCNEDRKKIEEEIIEAAEEQIRLNPGILNRKILIVKGDNWPHGVIGLASSKLLHKYGKPNIVITIEGDTARGSGRSFDGFSLVQLLKNCEEHLIRYGGHTKAAGLNVSAEKIDDFINAAYAYCDTVEAVTESIAVDMEIQPSEMILDNVRLMEKLEPFGEENPLPVFLLKNCTINSKSSLKDGKFVAFNFTYGGKEYRGLDFGCTYADFLYQQGDRVDILANLEINEFNNTTNIKVMVKDMRYNGFQQDRFLAAGFAYEDYRCGNVDRRLICRMTPTGEELRSCYDILKATSCMSKAAMVAANMNINYCKFRIVLDVFEEFGLVKIDVTSDRATIVKGAPKADLTKSKILAKLSEM